MRLVVQLIFHDKYAIIKLLQINNLVEVPLVVKDNRTFLDFTDLVKIRLVDGYPLFKLKILNKETLSNLNNKIQITFQDLENPKANFQSRTINKDANTFEIQPNLVNQGQWLAKKLSGSCSAL